MFLLISSVAHEIVSVNKEMDKSPKNGEMNRKTLRKKQKTRQMKIESQGLLLQIARDAIRYHLEGRTPLKLQGLDAELLQESGAFVTLHKEGELRGCVGQIASDNPLLVNPFSTRIELRGLLKLIAIIGDSSAGNFCIVFPFEDVCKFSVAVRLFTLTCYQFLVFSHRD